MTAIDNFKTQQKPKWEDGKHANGANFAQFIDAIATAIQETVNESAGGGVSLDDVKTAINDGTINIEPIINSTVTAGVTADTYKIKDLVQKGIDDGTITIPNSGTGEQNLKFGRHTIDKYNLYSYNQDNDDTLMLSGFDYYDDMQAKIATPTSVDIQIVSGKEYLQHTMGSPYRFLQINYTGSPLLGYIFRPDGVQLFLQYDGEKSGYTITPVPVIIG